nr:hypothetical protein [Tanacetum cinerariifolium]
MNESLSLLTMRALVVEVVVKWSDGGRGGICEGMVVKRGKRLSCTLCAFWIAASKLWEKFWNCPSSCNTYSRLINGGDSFEEMSITLFLANFLGGFLVDDEALEANLKRLRRILRLIFSGFLGGVRMMIASLNKVSSNTLSACKTINAKTTNFSDLLFRQLDQGFNYPLDHSLLDLEWERVTKMISNEFEGEAFSHQSLSYASCLW